MLSRVTKIPRDSWRNIFRFMPTLMGILFILSSYGISISPLLTALGAGGLASALALQDTLANLFSGITTLVSKQVHMGDYATCAKPAASSI